MRVEAGLLRIAQGAVSNVINHAGASIARITLTYAPDEVRLDVVDNGRGFDVNAQGLKPSGLGHLGLDAMRSRAVELGGKLEIDRSIVLMPREVRRSGCHLPGFFRRSNMRSSVASSKESKGSLIALSSARDSPR